MCGNGRHEQEQSVRALTCIIPLQMGLRVARKAFQPPSGRLQRPSLNLLIDEPVELCHGNLLGTLDVRKHRLARCRVT